MPLDNKRKPLSLSPTPPQIALTQNGRQITLSGVAYFPIQDVFGGAVYAINRFPEEVMQHYLNPLSLVLPLPSRNRLPRQTWGAGDRRRTEGLA